MSGWWWRFDARMLAVFMLAPTIVLAQGADDLAMTIEQNLEGIAFRLELRPSQAAHDLEAQGRQLELLAKQAPNHPSLPKLEKTYASLQDEIAASLAGAASDAASGRGLGQTPTAPAGFVTGMQEVAVLEQRAEAEFFGGNTDQATGYLDQAEAQIAALENRYQTEIPPGHVPLLVAKEKLAALRDQVAAKK